MTNLTKVNDYIWKIIAKGMLFMPFLAPFFAGIPIFNDASFVELLGLYVGGIYFSLITLPFVVLNPISWVIAVVVLWCMKKISVLWQKQEVFLVHHALLLLFIHWFIFFILMQNCDLQCQTGDPFSYKDAIRFGFYGQIAWIPLCSYATDYFFHQKFIKLKISRKKYD